MIQIVLMKIHSEGNRVVVVEIEISIYWLLNLKLFACLNTKKRNA